MITLPHHCEFLSDAWMEEARKFVSREAALRKDRLTPFSLSECFTDAPPHMKFRDNAAFWTLRYDGETVTAERAFDENADLVVQGDYQAALEAAQYVGILSPRVAQAMSRDVAHWFGKDAIRAKGAIENQAVTDLLSLLHDHMGRRTVENPDLKHRAERLGIAGHVRHMEEHGYAILENAIHPDFADEVREATLRALLPYQAFSLQWMLYHGVEFERIAQNPQLMTLIDASLGRGAVIASLSSIRKGPGPGAIPIHTDYAHVPEPYPEFALTGVGVWALENWTRDSGPTWIVPDSHKMRRPPRPGEGHNAGMPVEMPKGSVVFFTHGVWHWQGDRNEPGDRVTLHMHFNRGILRSLEPKKVDPQMMARNAPRLGEMLGEDDWFDKMAGIGRDHVRAAYMGQLLAFNEKQKKALLQAA